MWEAGADGIDFDTAGAGGDADLLATLLAVERLRARYPAMGIMVGMAGGGRARHARPARVSRYAAGRAQAGGPVPRRPGGGRHGSSGPAVNVNTSRTVAWNVARALTFMKPCMDVARIPVHANVGMGVGGVPMYAFSPVDAVSRCSRACVDILKVDGL